jgi:hypothetical protein
VLLDVERSNLCCFSVHSHHELNLDFVLGFPLSFEQTQRPLVNAHILDSDADQ